jgi:hypothetical protein
LKRERVEKERERALFMKQSQRAGGFSRRWVLGWNYTLFALGLYKLVVNCCYLIHIQSIGLLTLLDA